MCVLSQETHEIHPLDLSDKQPWKTKVFILAVNDPWNKCGNSWIMKQQMFGIFGINVWQINNKTTIQHKSLHFTCACLFVLTKLTWGKRLQWLQILSRLNKNKPFDKTSRAEQEVPGRQGKEVEEVRWAYHRVLRTPAPVQAQGNQW